MRVALAVLGVVLVLPAASAHGGSASEGLARLTAMMAGIEAGDGHEHALVADEGPLREGWIFVLVAAQQDVQPGLRVALVHENGAVAANWTLEPGATRHLAVAIPETGEYELAVTSDANATTRYAFYYDVSCNCAAKTVPWEVTPGLVVFNVDGRPGDGLGAGFPERSGLRFRVTAAERIGGSGSWPDDFRPLDVSGADDLQERDAKIHRIQSVFPDSGRLYFFVETVRFMPGYEVEDLVITPAFGSDEAAAPANVAAAAVLAVMGAAATRRFRVRLRANS